jgi:lipoate-protein ligase B
MPHACCFVYKLGRIDYTEALSLQRELVRARQDGTREDTLLLLEHPEVIAVGASSRPEDIIVSPGQLEELGISVVYPERGGRVTYHGPGQVVGYPIMDLAFQEKDVHRYIRNLEEVIIQVLRDFRIQGERNPGYPGVWVGTEKIAAIGVAVRRWVTYHGFAININPDMSRFRLINPCGLGQDSVISIAQLVNPLPDLRYVEDRISLHFGEVFDREMVPAEPKALFSFEKRAE